MQRREFLQSAAGWSAIPILGRSKTKYRTALIGAGSQGRDILRSAMEVGHSKVVALCDVDEDRLVSAAADVRRLTGGAPARYRDYGEMLAKEKPEICIVATPDHSHAVITSAAAEAGAHVWVEAPLYRTINEGRAVVNVVRDSRVVVQIGARSHNASGLAFLESGRLGRVNHVRVCTSSSASVAGDVAAHFAEILEWSGEKWPTKVFSVGTRHGSEGDSNVPDTLVSTFEFENFTAGWEHRQYGGSRGVYYYGAEGTLHTDGNHGWTFTPASRNERSIHVHGSEACTTETGWRAFLAAIEDAKGAVRHIEAAQRATNMSLLARISMNLGRSVVWDGVKMEITGDAAANTLLARPYHHSWDDRKA